MVSDGGWHVGRSWSGTEKEDACPCPKQLCGLVLPSDLSPECTEHPVERAKSMRQGHPAAECVPALVAEVERLRAEVFELKVWQEQASEKLFFATSEVERLRRENADLRARHELEINDWAAWTRDEATGRDQLRAERGAWRDVIEAAKAWREMRRGSPTKPKPESAALAAAVDALSQPEAQP